MEGGKRGVAVVGGEMGISQTWVEKMSDHKFWPQNAN